MVEYLSESIPDCIKEDVVAGIKEQIGNAKIFHRLIKKQEVEEGIAAALATVQNILRRTNPLDQEMDFKQWSRHQLRKILINKPTKLKHRLVNGGDEYLTSYLKILRELGFDPDYSGGIDYDLPEEQIRDLLDRLAAAASKLRNYIHSLYMQQLQRLPYRHIDYSAGMSAGRLIYSSDTAYLGGGRYTKNS